MPHSIFRSQILLVWKSPKLSPGEEKISNTRCHNLATIVLFEDKKALKGQTQTDNSVGTADMTHHKLDTSLRPMSRAFVTGNHIDAFG